MFSSSVSPAPVVPPPVFVPCAPPLIPPDPPLASSSPPPRSCPVSSVVDLPVAVIGCDSKHNLAPCLSSSSKYDLVASASCCSVDPPIPSRHSLSSSFHVPSDLPPLCSPLLVWPGTLSSSFADFAKSFMPFSSKVIPCSRSSSVFDAPSPPPIISDWSVDFVEPSSSFSLPLSTVVINNNDSFPRPAHSILTSHSLGTSISSHSDSAPSISLVPPLASTLSPLVSIGSSIAHPLSPTSSSCPLSSSSSASHPASPLPADWVASVMSEVCADSGVSSSDIFPLPLLPAVHLSSSSSRRCRTRNVRSIFHSSVYNELVSALNSLNSSFYRSSPVRSPSSSSSPSVGNKSSTDRVSSFLHTSVASYVRSRGLSKVGGAFSVVDSIDFPIFSSFDPYLSSPSVVPLLASKVSLPSSRSPIPLLSMLPPNLVSIYSSPSLLKSVPLPPSASQLNTKPAMCSSSEWLAMVHRLDDLAMVDFTTEPKVVNSVFCLDKPDSSQRFLINAVPANKFFADPPNPRLPSPDLVASLLPSRPSKLFAAKVDLECFYFYLALPSWLVPFFAMPSVRAGDVSAVLAAKFGADTLVFPCFNRLPMGWNHSVFVAQAAHIHALISAKVLCLDDMLSSDNDFRLDRVRWFIYIDDFCIIGSDPVLLRKLQDAYLAAVRSFGLIPKSSKLFLPSSDPIPLLGLDFNGASGIYGLSVAKLSCLRADTERFVCSATATGLQLAALLGRWAWAMMVRRSALSVFSAVFNFVQAAGAVKFSIWCSVRKELSVASRLAPLLFASLLDRPFPVPVAVDASGSGAGVVALAAPLAAVAAVASMSQSRSDLPGSLSLDEAFPLPVVPSLVASSVPGRAILSSPSRVACAYPWRHQEHINAFEMRAALSGLRKVVSSPSSLGSRALLFTDSAVVFFALRKGRCSSHLLLRRLRPISALSLASGVRVLPVWLPSESNPADAPSRAWKVTSSWSLPKKELNRRQHALNGNPPRRAKPSSSLPLSFLPSASEPMVSFDSKFLAGPMSKEARAAFSPAAVPFLRAASVAPSTFKNYSDQLAYFFLWCAHNNHVVASLGQVDMVFEAFLHSFFKARSGRGLALARNAFMALCLFYPKLRPLMPLSRRALKGWEKLAPSVSHPPLSWALTVVLAVKMACQARSVLSSFSYSVATLVAWEAYLRVGELCALTIGDVQFLSELDAPVSAGSKPAKSSSRSSVPRSPVLVSLHLAHTKTGDHQWAHIRSPEVASLFSSFLKMRKFLAGASGASLVFGFSTSSFRNTMARARDALSLSSDFTPHSLRHGHATHDYESGATVQDIAIRGRWRTLDSLLIYVQSGPARAVQFRPPPSLFPLMAFAKDNLTELLQEVFSDHLLNGLSLL